MGTLLNSRSGRRIPETDLSGVWPERSHKEAEFAESQRPGWSRGQRISRRGPVPGGSRGAVPSHWPAGLPAESPALAVVRQWRRPAAAAAAGWRAGDAGRSSSPGRDAGRHRPELCSAGDDTTQSHAADRSASPRPRPVPRPARAAITALPGPAWMRSRARPSAPRAAPLPPASAPTTMGPGPGVQFPRGLFSLVPARSGPASQLAPN